MLRFVRSAAFAVLALGTAGAAVQPERLGQTGLVSIVRVPHGGIQPQVVVHRGLLHLLYFAGESRAGNLFYAQSTDAGATFSTPVQVNSQDGSAIATGTIRGGHLAIGRDGRVHVAWNGSETAQPRLSGSGLEKYQTAPFLYARSNLQRTAFEPQRNLMRRTHSLDGGGSIAVDEASNVYAVWHAGPVGASADESQRRVWICRSSDNGATFARETPTWEEATGVCGCCGLGVFAHPTHGLWMLYRAATEKTHRDIYLMGSNDRGRTFKGSRVQEWNLNACPMTSVAFAGADRMLAAWETAGQVYFGTVDPATARVAAPIAAPGSTDGRKHPRLAIAPNGDTLLVWTEGMGWARGGSLAWQVFGGSGKPAQERGAAPAVPMWSFAAAAARPDGGFVILY
jgi:hypothetical protein